MKMPIPIYPVRPEPAAELEMMRRAVHGKITSREPMKFGTLALFAASTGLVFSLGALIHQLLH